MIYTVLSGKKEEMQLIEKVFREETADNTDEQLNAVLVESVAELEEFLKRQEQADLICVDITALNGVRQAERLRGLYPKSVIILLADENISPISYMKPSILAAALMLKPLSWTEARRTVKEVFASFISQGNQEDLFVLETREGKQRLPYSSILYFEARLKKVYACTSNQEYGFYDTIDSLEGKLNDIFVRCHRSYLANKAYIEKVRLSANCIHLKGDIELPLSRSCKEKIKELNL